MTKGFTRINRRRSALDAIRRRSERADNVLVVHYSCESFYDREGRGTPRITSITARNLASGQSESFSIHKIAEKRKVLQDQIAEQYDAFEKAMLDEYFEFLRSHSNQTWLHWNMRDSNYGFHALEHRCEVLGGTPATLEESRKFDLARCLVDIYGLQYIGHPRLENLVRKNEITARDFLSGWQEAEAFENRQYTKLHQSTLRKVDILANIFPGLSTGT